VACQESSAFVFARAPQSIAKNLRVFGGESFDINHQKSRARRKGEDITKEINFLNGSFLSQSTLAKDDANLLFRGEL
jgi:hypothetical protein